MGNINIHNMASRYIARRYGETSSELTRRGTSMTREVRARSSSREPGQYNIRSRSYSPARASGQSQFSNNLQYYRPVQNEVKNVHLCLRQKYDAFFSQFTKGTCCFQIS